MTPCGISWCVALTNKQFCPIHEKDQALHPRELTEENDIVIKEDDDNEDYQRGREEALDDARSALDGLS